jgi:tripartite-type tricarboxylate transporter receptor subunit TctC
MSYTFPTGRDSQRGSASITDLLGGQIAVIVDSIAVIEPQVRAGTIRALGVVADAKIPQQ